MQHDENIASQAYLLLDYAQRLDRHREGRRAVHIHLSRLKPQNRREQHIRVAVNTFQELVSQFDGQVFVLNNCDLVFLFKDAKISDIDEAVMRLRYLFSEDPLAQGSDEEDLARFCTWYNIQGNYNLFLEVVEKLYEDEQRRERRLAAAAEAAGEVEISADDRTPLSPEQLGRLENFLERADLSSVLRRQHICAVIGENPPQSIFKELFISIGDLATTVLPDVNLVANRWLFQHLTQTLDRRVLKLLSRADDSDLFSSFSLNLNIDTLVHPDFIEFDKSLRTGSRGTIVVELQPVDVFADFNAFMFARDFAREKGYRICLDGVDMNFFEFIDRKKLGLDLIKLVWSPELSSDRNKARREEMGGHIEALGKSRIIMSRCDTPASVRLGQSLGITMFQGRYIDSLLQSQRSYIPAPKMAPRRRAISR
jgi:EAL domain-containing protein (putative c-di-GMP-specific phosphodiesterase class I)